MDLRLRTDKLAELMEERLGTRGGGFATKVRRAGRRLPRHLRVEARYLVHARDMEDNPRLARQIDQPRVDRACAALERWLDGLDPKARRRNLLLDWLAANAFNLLMIAALVAAILAWRGLL